jgi:integrase
MNERIPKVRMAKPTGRPIQLRYTDPTTGKEVRITTKTHDPIIAEEEKAKLEAKLLLGIDAKPRKRIAAGPNMPWELFRERYTELQLNGLRDKSAIDAESRLDIAERILKPRTLADVANSEALHNLQARLLAGEESEVGKKGERRPRGPRSPVTARNYVVTVLAALSWAEYMGWLPAVPKVRKLKLSKLRQMKGRPLVGEEFDRMLAAVESEVGAEAAPSWKYVLRGAWESGLRLGELMHLHWSDERYIVPLWKRGTLPVLSIPAAMQKNDTEESIPLLPGFESLLLETPKAERFGWVFNPMSLHTKLKRPVRGSGRATAAWVGEVISRIGEAAGVIVRPAAGDGEPKYASAHDLRRSCAERLIAAGVPEREVSRVLRHASVETTRRHYAPGTVQESAGVIRKLLTVPRYSEEPQLT